MVTKGIIKKLPETGSNYFYVQIPYLVKANDDINSVLFPATAVCLAGIDNNYNVGDVVFIAFEEDQFDKPVIVGKMWLNGTTKKSTVNGIMNTLVVENKTQLNGTVIINGKNVNNLLVKLEQIED